jgi:hypothetical protein
MCNREGVATLVPTNIAGLVALIIVLVTLFIYFGLKKDNDEDFRCPKSNFLVDAKDIEKYGDICPDCRTDWRIYPLKKNEE